MGQRVSGVQDTGHIIGLAGLYTADGVRQLNPLQPKDENNQTHPQNRMQHMLTGPLTFR